jgi:glycosyltransferase involved in cell wall biosynthesis
MGEAGQIFCGRILRKPLWADRVWEWQERGLAKEAVSFLRSGNFSAYLGLEHGALEALVACRDLGVRSCLVFTSPHHRFRKKWEKITEEAGFRVSKVEQELNRRAIERDKRRDEEMEWADFIRTNSSLVGDSLIQGGAYPKKIINIPLGADLDDFRPFKPRKKGEPLRFVVSGRVSQRKGAHFLLDAWRRLRPKAASLHFYGSVMLEPKELPDEDEGVFFHGNRTPAEVLEAYREAHALIFPTLCDGFGMVVPEAMAAGCAVITTKNAGAADWVSEGKSGWKVKAGSVTALEEAIQKILDAGPKLEQMREAAQATAKANSWDSFRVRFVQTLVEQGFLRIPS